MTSKATIGPRCSVLGGAGSVALLLSIVVLLSVPPLPAPSPSPLPGPDQAGAAPQSVAPSPGVNGSNDRHWVPVQSTAGEVPDNGATAYDPDYDGIIAFGGEGAYWNTVSDVTHATWLYRNGTWTQLCNGATTNATCPQAPPARDSDLMVYDSHDHQLLMVGGETREGGGTLTDTWALRNSTWVQLSSSTPITGFSTLGSDRQLIDDPSQGLVMLARYDVSTATERTFVFANGTWTTGPSWPGGHFPYLFYDPAFGEILGVAPWPWYGSGWVTYGFNGSTWSPLPNVAAPALGNGSVTAIDAAAFDSTTGEEVLVGSVDLAPTGQIAVLANGVLTLSRDQWTNISDQIEGAPPSFPLMLESYESDPAIGDLTLVYDSYASAYPQGPAGTTQIELLSSPLVGSLDGVPTNGTDVGSAANLTVGGNHSAFWSS